MDKTHIRRLAMQATEYCIARGENAAWLWEDKFTELIIAECTNLFPQQNMYGGAAIQNMIKEHFGVK